MANRFNGGKPKVSLIPPEMIFGLTSAFDEGVVKYGRENWRSGQGLVWSEVYDSAQRHMLAWLSGEDIDPTSGTSHLAKAAWNMLVLDFYRQHKDEFGKQDDRYAKQGEVVHNMNHEKPENPEQKEISLDEAIALGEMYKPPRARLSGDMSGITTTGGMTPWSHDCDRCAGKSVLEELQAEIAAWADVVFPNRTAHGSLTKLMLEEIPELISSKLLSPTEYADVVILVLDIAYLKGINVGAAVREKMKINRERKWKINPETGLMNHVEEK